MARQAADRPKYLYEVHKDLVKDLVIRAHGTDFLLPITGVKYHIRSRYTYMYHGVTGASVIALFNVVVWGLKL